MCERLEEADTRWVGGPEGSRDIPEASDDPAAEPDPDPSDEDDDDPEPTPPIEIWCRAMKRQHNSGRCQDAAEPDHQKLRHAKFVGLIQSDRLRNITQNEDGRHDWRETRRASSIIVLQNILQTRG